MTAPEALPDTVQPAAAPPRDQLLRTLLGRRRLALGTRANERLLDWIGTVAILLLAAVTCMILDRR